MNSNFINSISKDALNAQFGSKKLRDVNISNANVESVSVSPVVNNSQKILVENVKFGNNNKLLVQG